MRRRGRVPAPGCGSSGKARGGQIRHLPCPEDGGNGYPSNCSFCQFQQLPSEIRDRIWLLCIDTPRSTSVQQTNDVRLAFRKNDVPAVLKVCKDSRRVAREVYEPLLKPNPSGLQFYAHIASDCLHIQIDRRAADPAIEHTLFNFASCLDAVISPSRTLVMPLHSVLPHKEDCYWCSGRFMNHGITFYMGTLCSFSKYSMILQRGLDEDKIGEATEFMDSDDDDMPELEGENANEPEGEDNLPGPWI